MSMMTNATKTIRTYTELAKLKSFDERFKYLQLNGSVGSDTFGFDRYMNQIFYRSRDWKRIREWVIIRDNGCDLGIEGRDVYGKNILIHHMNPLMPEDIINRTDHLLNPDYLITTSHLTHNAIHYGDETLLFRDPVERRPFDTCPWKL